jgi:hypothetical protein
LRITEITDKVLVGWLEGPLSKDASERTLTDNDVLELFCQLFHNLLAVPDPIRARSTSDW